MIDTSALRARWRGESQDGGGGRWRQKQRKSGEMMGAYEALVRGKKSDSFFSYKHDFVANSHLSRFRKLIDKIVYETQYDSCAGACSLTLSGLTLTLWNDCMNWEIEHNYQSLINQEKWKASLTLRTLLSLSGPPSLSCSLALLCCFRSVVFNQPLVDVDIDWGSVICSGLVACQDQTNICLCVCVLVWHVCSLPDGLYPPVHTQGKWSLLYPFC